jgi:hypothetical protein
MPLVNPLNSPNANEVLRRDKALRQETLRRQPADSDGSSGKRKGWFARLAEIINGQGR